MKLPDKPMAEQQFGAFRSELLKTSTQLSCRQILDLADLFHTVIRLRKPYRPVQNLEALFCDDDLSFDPQVTEERAPASS